MPEGRAMTTVDERVVRASVLRIFDVARRVEEWPAYLDHYRYVRFRERRADGGVVEMSAFRPFGPVGWPTWWTSEMSVDAERPAIRFRHIGGITKGMDVEWSFEPADQRPDSGPDGGSMPAATRVRIVHVWDGPTWPLIGVFAATAVIGPVFVHGIASRTLAGLAAVAERGVG
jgi:ribosome-associated toxin RatA of RatAB toxin-antitoxin module